MLTRSVRIRLSVFAVISVVVLAMTAVWYIQLPHLLGFGQFQVHAEFTDATGLYANANVTYRGASVGKVGAIDLGRDGVSVTLDIDDGTHIPTDSTASVHSTSAIGEQYVDLIPKTASTAGPVLHNGSTIPRADTRGLPSTSQLIDSLDQLIHSVPGGAASRTLNDIATAFGGAGPDLQRLLNSASSLLDSAQQNFGPTKELLRSLSPFLHTQQDVASQTTSTVSNLSTFTHQLVLSNDDIVGLIRDTPALTTQVTGLESDLTPSLNVLLANLTSTGQVLKVYEPATKQILTIFPALVAGLIEFAQPTAATGKIPLYFHLNLDDPPACDNGFIPVSDRRDPTDTSTINTPSGLYCKEPAAGPASVRGARNLPCLNNPGKRAATPAACLGLPEPTSTTVATYKASDGSTIAPDGTKYVVHEIAPRPNDPQDSWQDLLLKPLGK